MQISDLVTRVHYFLPTEMRMQPAKGAIFALKRRLNLLEMKKSVMTLVVMFMVMTLTSASDYASLQLKASRFIDQKEWASAAAMLDLMLEDNPADASVYGRAIVVADIREDSVGALRLVDRAMEFHVPFDSVFSSVKKESFRLGRSDLYERFLLSVTVHQPWLSRAIDGYLTDYYAFRRNGPEMIKYSSRMLKGLPDNVGFLKILAQGYLLTGQTRDAVDTYRHINAVAPDDYETLLYLGNYYFDQSSQNRSVKEYRALAATYLSRAAAIRQTPYVGRKLRELEKKSF